MDGRVSARSPGGEIRVIAANLPGANGIAIHSDRIFVDEFRPGGRLLEYMPTAERHELLVDDAQMPNALCAGPDGLLYYLRSPRPNLARSSGSRPAGTLLRPDCPCRPR